MQGSRQDTNSKEVSYYDELDRIIAPKGVQKYT